MWIHLLISIGLPVGWVVCALGAARLSLAHDVKKNDDPEYEAAAIIAIFWPVALVYWLFAYVLSRKLKPAVLWAIQPKALRVKIAEDARKKASRELAEQVRQAKISAGLNELPFPDDQETTSSPSIRNCGNLRPHNRHYIYQTDRQVYWCGGVKGA